MKNDIKKYSEIIKKCKEIEQMTPDAHDEIMCALRGVVRGLIYVKRDHERMAARADLHNVKQLFPNNP